MEYINGATSLPAVTASPSIKLPYGVAAGSAIIAGIAWMSPAGTVNSVTDTINAGSYTILPGSFVQARGITVTWYYLLNSNSSLPLYNKAQNLNQNPSFQWAGSVTGFNLSGTPNKGPTVQASLSSSVDVMIHAAEICQASSGGGPSWNIITVLQDYAKKFNFNQPF